MQYNQDKHPYSYTKYCTKIRYNLKSRPLCLWQNVIMYQMATERKTFNTFLYKLKTSCQWRVTSAFPWFSSRWCVQHALQPLALAAVSVRAACGRYPRACMQYHPFCLVIGRKFNTKCALFLHQPPTLPQKIDSREGWFWCKKGLAYEYDKMNFYLKETAFAPVFGLFAAKHSACWC